MMSPVTGPAMFSSGRLCGSAFRNEKIGLIAVCCIPKLYWIPKNPKFIRMICWNVSGGRKSAVAGAASAPRPRAGSWA